jgi:hypothetical protein
MLNNATCFGLYGKDQDLLYLKMLNKATCFGLYGKYQNLLYSTMIKNARCSHGPKHVALLRIVECSKLSLTVNSNFHWLIFHLLFLLWYGWTFGFRSLIYCGIIGYHMVRCGTYEILEAHTVFIFKDTKMNTIRSSETWKFNYQITRRHKTNVKNRTISLHGGKSFKPYSYIEFEQLNIPTIKEMLR